MSSVPFHWIPWFCHWVTLVSPWWAANLMISKAYLVLSFQLQGRSVYLYSIESNYIPSSITLPFVVETCSADHQQQGMWAESLFLQWWWICTDPLIFFYIIPILKMVHIFNTGYPSRGRSFVAGEQRKANFGIRYFRCFSDQIIWEERERTGVERVHFISGLKFEGGKGSWKCRESYLGENNTVWPHY